MCPALLRFLAWPRRDEGAYPQRSVTEEQRRPGQKAKQPGGRGRMGISTDSYECERALRSRVRREPLFEVSGALRKHPRRGCRTKLPMRCARSIILQRASSALLRCSLGKHPPRKSGFCSSTSELRRSVLSGAARNIAERKGLSTCGKSSLAQANG